MATITNQSPHQPIPSLSLPPSQFARLQPHAYLLAHLSPPASSNQPSIRANGRDPSQFRVTSVNTGSLTHTNGSAVVRIGDTAAVCGVRAEILHTEDIASWNVSHSSPESGASRNKQRRLTSSRNYASGHRKEEEQDGDGDDDDDDDLHIQGLNLLVPNVSLSTGCAPGLIPGAPPSTLAQSLSHQVLSLLHSTRLIRADDLRIWYQSPVWGDEQLEPHAGTGLADVDMDAEERQDAGTANSEIKAFWVLYIDIMVISLAGNPFDVAWTAVLAALRDTRLPKAWWDTDNGMVLCSDNISEAHQLSLRGLPVSSSFCVFEADAAASWRAVVVLDAEEERKASEVGRKGNQRRWILADPDGYEESLSQERACIVVDRENKEGGETIIVKMEKYGGWSLDTKELQQLVDISAKRREEIEEILERC